MGFEIKLILEVKNHSCLYAKDNPEYSNRTKRSDSWDEIAAILGKTVDECQKKWTNLRNSFRQYLRQTENVPSGSGATPSVKWVHFQTLKFLIPYVKVPEDDCGNFSQPSNNLQLDSSEIITVTDSDDGLSQKPRGYKKKNNKKRQNDEPIERVLKAIENNNTRSPMEIFFENIALQVGHFSPQRTIRFQSRILQVLAEEMTE